MEFLNLLKEEWIYHLSNIGIILLFSIYGAYSTISKKIKLEVFRLTEKRNTKITEEEKNIIIVEQKKGFIKELLKAFFALFIIYVIYIVYRSGILL